MTGTKTLNIYQRINAIMAEVHGVAKKDRNQFAKYSYAGHESVTAALRGAYVKHGVVRAASVVASERSGGLLRLQVQVSFINIEDPADRATVTM